MVLILDAKPEQQRALLRSTLVLHPYKGLREKFHFHTIPRLVRFL